MGNIVSAIGSDIDSVVQSVGKLVTDVNSAVDQLSTIAKGFAEPPALHSSQLTNASSYAISMADAEDIDSALKNAMTGAKSAADKLFKKTFSGVSAAGTDNGVVKDYQSGGGVECVVQQMTQDFQNWGIDADSATITGMAQTIKNNVAAQIGIAGTAQGHHNVNMNQKIDWTVAYGLFAMGNNQQGLVYAYTAAFDGGF